MAVCLRNNPMGRIDAWEIPFTYLSVVDFHKLSSIQWLIKQGRSSGHLMLRQGCHERHELSSQGRCLVSVHDSNKSRKWAKTSWKFVCVLHRYRQYYKIMVNNFITPQARTVLWMTSWRALPLIWSMLSRNAKLLDLNVLATRKNKWYCLTQADKGWKKAHTSKESEKKKRTVIHEQFHTKC